MLASLDLLEVWRPMKPATMIESIRIKGFRSLADVEISDLPQATVLIGANGSGKSNFIRFFEMLSAIGHRRLSEFVAMQGGADDQLFGGNRTTPHLEAEINLRTPQGCAGYRFALSYTHPDRFFFRHEFFSDPESPSQEPTWRYVKGISSESTISRAGFGYDDALSQQMTVPPPIPDIVNLLRNCSVYQFHDTSDRSDFMKRWDIEDNARLHGNGSNLAAVLYRLEREDTKRYEIICRHIGRVLPGFDRFDIEESYGKVLLRWRAKWTDKTIGAHLTSDGSLRFFALVTLLNLPAEMLPDVILLDEPELGLHPAAISLVAAMIQSQSVEKQVIVATQSTLLVNEFDIDEIIVLDLKDGRTKLRKLKADEYKVWAESDYSTGELWWKNIFGGYP